MRKKVFAAAVCIAALVAAIMFTACGEEPRRGVPGLCDEMTELICKTYYDTYAYNDEYAIYPDGLEIVYHGAYDEQLIVTVDVSGMYDPDEIAWTAEVHDTTIDGIYIIGPGPSYCRFMAYSLAEGDIVRLEDAYENGRLTREGLKAFAVDYTEAAGYEHGYFAPPTYHDSIVKTA